MDLIIVTGLSGAGKSQVMNALEDIGYFCIDNLPPSLIPRFAEMSMQLNSNGDIAIVTDVRTGDMFNGFLGALNDLQAMEISYKILFLDCSDEVLINRYRESRRKHPLANNENSLIDAVRDERAMLKAVLEVSDYRVDTTYLSIQQLKDTVLSIFMTDSKTSMRVRCLSFGFKHGIPQEADLVLDVRFLPNPFYIESMKNKTGLDSEVSEYVLGSPETKELLARFIHLIEFLVPRYKTEGKSQLVIAIGCTGGKHRSVTLAEYLSNIISEMGYRCKAIHRDINKTV